MALLKVDVIYTALLLTLVEYADTNCVSMLTQNYKNNDVYTKLSPNLRIQNIIIFNIFRVLQNIQGHNRMFPFPSRKVCMMSPLAASLGMLTLATMTPWTFSLVADEGKYLPLRLG